MNNYQNAQVNMLDAVKLFFTENMTITNTFPPLTTQITQFTDIHTNLKQAIQLQIIPTTGITADKKEEAEKLIEMILPKARLAHAWAVTTKNNDLAQIFDTTEYNLERLTENDLTSTAQNIHDTLNNNLSALTPYGFTPTTLTTIQSQIDLFQNLIGTPEVASSNRETATKAIAQYIKNATDILKITDDLIFGNFTDTEPAFVNIYNNVRQIINTGTRHTGIRATITTSGSDSPIQNATLLLHELNRTATSNITGTAEILKFTAGTYHFTTSHPTHQPLTQILKITRGKILEINIQLPPL